jgi:hypothetical protein
MACAWSGYRLGLVAAPGGVIVEPLGARGYLAQGPLIREFAYK